MITIKQMEAIYWVDKLGSFEAAGRKLCTSQAAISKRVQEIEEAFSLQLFDRSLRRARLTDKGRDVLARSTEILRMHTALVESMGLDHPVAGKLQLGVTELVALTWLPSFIAKLRRSHPHVTVLPRVDSSNHLKRQLASALVDMIVVPGIAASRSTDGFIQKYVGESKQIWMVHPSLLKASKAVPLSTFADMTVLTLNEQSYIGDLVLQWMAGHGVVPKEHLSSNSNSALSGMVMAGLGIANLPLHFLPLSRDRKLSVIDTLPSLPTITYRVMYRDDGPTAFHEEIAGVIAECCDFSARA